MSERPDEPRAGDEPPADAVAGDAASVPDDPPAEPAADPPAEPVADAPAEPVAEPPASEPVAPVAGAPAAEVPALPVGPLVALLALWALAFGDGVPDMVRRWLGSQSYYAHGPLVPLVVGWMLWRERDALRAVPRRAAWGGFALLVPALLLTAVGQLEDVKVFQNLALLASLYGLVWVLAGRRLLLRAWVPAAFLLFMVPLPGFVLDRLTFGLKMLAAKLSVASIHLAGLPAILDGGTIHLAHTDVLVDDVCSGLKTMVALVGFAVVFAYLQRTRLKAALILALAIPVAIVANVVRILLLCWLAAAGSKAAFEGPLHEGTGLVVYALALVLFLGLQALPLPGDPEPADEEAEPPAPPPPTAEVELPSRGQWAGLFAVAGLGALLTALTFAGARADRGPDTHVTASIPARIGPWESTQVRLGEHIYEVLGTHDATMRRYTRAASAATVDLYVTYAAGDIFRVAHPPERCFAGGGYTEQARRVIQIPLGERSLSVNRIVFRKDAQQVLVYYWYRLNGKDVAAYTQYRFGSLLRRLQRYDSSGSMIRLSTNIDARGIPAAEARLTRFVHEALPAALEPIGG